MMTILESVLGRQRVLVKENERAIVLYKGEVRTILEPGEHFLANRGGSLDVVRQNIAASIFDSPFEKALCQKLPDVATRHLRIIRTGNDEVAVIERDGVMFAVLAPNRSLTLWEDAGPWVETRLDISAGLSVAPDLLRRLGQARKIESVMVQAIVEGQVGLLYVDGSLTATLPPGVHGFWNVGRLVQVRTVDTRQLSLDVTGQEILTRDRVTIRVNIAAEYRVVDPVRATSSVKDFQDTLYRSLQFAFRRMLGSQTLDQILDRKAGIDEETAAKVRATMAELGVEVGDIALKDVILPGEMREILNQVVSAEKQAEANVIRRREETNATRSLLNTARLMAENPVMLRLKELEALEAIAGKVERLTVHNGTGGLLNDLVKLRE